MMLFVLWSASSEERHRVTTISGTCRHLLFFFWWNNFIIHQHFLQAMLKHNLFVHSMDLPPGVYFWMLRIGINSSSAKLFLILQCCGYLRSIYLIDFFLILQVRIMQISLNRLNIIPFPHPRAVLSPAQTSRWSSLHSMCTFHIVLYFTSPLLIQLEYQLCKSFTLNPFKAVSMLICFGLSVCLLSWQG